MKSKGKLYYQKEGLEQELLLMKIPMRKDHLAVTLSTKKARKVVRGKELITSETAFSALKI